jgi:hypothetical protein
MNLAGQTTTGHTVEFRSLGFYQLLEIIRRISSGQSVFFLLQDETVSHGISEGLPANPEWFAEGRAFADTCELRWKLSSPRGEQRLFDAMLLTESEELSAQLGLDEGNPRHTWDVALFSYDDATDDGIPPAKLWAPTETRLPVQPQYPPGLLVGYAVYQDQSTHSARFTRLIARLKAPGSARKEAGQ